MHKSAFILCALFVYVLASGCRTLSAPTPTPEADNFQQANGSSITQSAGSATKTVSTTLPSRTPTPTIDVVPLEVDRSRLSDELRIYNWPDYIDLAVIDGFEELYGVTVIVETYEAEEEVVETILSDNADYDVAVVADYAVDILRRAKKLIKLDKKLLPNFSYMNPVYTDNYYDPRNQYSVPYLAGITGIAYNKNVFRVPPDSWSALFDVKELKKYAGKASMLDISRESVGAALLYLGESVNNSESKVLRQVEEILKLQQPYLHEYDVADTLTAEQLVSGELVIAHAWSGTAVAAYRRAIRDEVSNVSIGFVVPKEGGIIWLDNLVVLHNSPNEYTAHVFLDYLMRPDISAINAQTYGYISPNRLAESMMPPELQTLYREDFGISESLAENLEWVTPENDEVFNELWLMIRTSND